MDSRAPALVVFRRPEQAPASGQAAAPSQRRGNKLSLLILFGIGILNFVTQDHLNAGVWLSIAAGAVITDLLECRKFGRRLSKALLMLEIAAVVAAFLFTAWLIATQVRKS